MRLVEICGKGRTRTSEARRRGIYSPLQLPLCDLPRTWVNGQTRTDINNIHSVAPQPFGHIHHNLEQCSRIELPSQPWQGYIITIIRTLHCLYPYKDSNPDRQIRVLKCSIHYTIEAESRVVESDHSNWFCRPGPDRSANPTYKVEVSGFEPELHQSK